jgi:hypothetical protein
MNMASKYYTIPLKWIFDLQVGYGCQYDVFPTRYGSWGIEHDQGEGKKGHMT